MARYRRTLKRFEEPGHARYLTCSCYHRLPLFTNQRIVAAFVEQLSVAKARLGFKLYAWVVMPDHFHLLIMPDPPGVTVTDVLRAIKPPFAARVLKRWRQLDAPVLSRLVDAQGRRHFWQRGGGYDRNIYSHRQLAAKIDYIHANPARRGLVTGPTDWPWSSARAYEHNPAQDALIDTPPL